MKSLIAALTLCVAVSGAMAVAPPVDPNVPPKIVPSGSPPPTSPGDPGDPNGNPLNTPEPASLTIMGLSLAAVGSYRYMRRRQLP
jgi:hypothetical protein